MNAAELDRYLAVKAAYELALTDGADHAAAVEVARDVATYKHRIEVLRRAGVPEAEAA